MPSTRYCLVMIAVVSSLAACNSTSTPSPEAMVPVNAPAAAVDQPGAALTRQQAGFDRWIALGATYGPVIESYGLAFEVPGAALPASADLDHKLYFFVNEEFPEQVSPRIDAVARFLNMNAQAGVPSDQTEVAVVLSGNALYDVVNHESYAKRNEGMSENPNIALLEALANAGVRIFVCGQNSASRNLAASDFPSSVKIAFSATHAIATLKSEGYEPRL